MNQNARKHQAIRDPAHARNLFFRRAQFSFVVVIIMSLALVSRLFYLQVINHQRFVTMSDENRVQLEPLAPTRGLILDRHGRVLADNQPSHQLSMVVERIKDLDTTLDYIGSLIE